jgi:hypothetical protein
MSRLAAIALLVCLVLLACNGALNRASPSAADAATGDDALVFAPSVGDDADLPFLPLPPGDGGTSVDTPGSPDNPGTLVGGTPRPSASASPSAADPLDGACPAPPSAGDLAIDELMIESVSGTGDYGEWIEVRSNKACALDLRGLHGDCPSGSKVRTFDVAEDLWIPAGGFFLVADSSNPVTNHGLPAPVLVWAGQPGDVLRNKGGTIDLSVGGALVDTLTFPALKLTVGASVAFPDDCDPSMRLDFTVWQTSVASYFPSFFGTPAAPNTDVHCSFVSLADAGDDAGS